MFILTNEQIRQAEETANVQGLTYEEMMEQAGKGCADFIIKRFTASKKIAVLCGKGKNGGDGYVLARYLCNAGKNVSVIRLFDTYSDELPEKNRNKLPDKIKVFTYPIFSSNIFRALQTADIIVDAIFGIGFSGSLPLTVRRVLSAAAVSPAVKIAIDMPSGLSIDREPEDSILKADHTLSMLALKREHITAPHKYYCGEVHIVPIGIGLRSKNLPYSLTLHESSVLLPARPHESNKGTFGKAMIIAGSINMPGAAVLAAKGCINSGAGLTQLVFPDKCAVGIVSKLSECVFMPLPTAENGEFSPYCLPRLSEALARCSAAAIGCGIGHGENSEELLTSVLAMCACPLVIDADGINILASHKDILKEAHCPVLLTPHPGEMARLTGTDTDTVNANREKIALDFAREYNVYVLLKGPNTVIAAPDGRHCINATGGAGLARGGSGDLLTGITVSLLAQGSAPFDALCTAAFVHGLAGDIAESRYTSYASTVERTADCLASAFLKISESK